MEKKRKITDLQRHQIQNLTTATHLRAVLDTEQKHKGMYTMCRLNMRTGMPQSNLPKMTQYMNNAQKAHNSRKKNFNSFTSSYTNYPKR